MRRLEPDLVVVQEAPRLLLWHWWRWQLARRAGLRLLTRERACGNLLLGAPGVTLLDSGVVELPHRPGLHRRAAVWARVVVDGCELVLAGTHLDLEPAARQDSAARVRAGLPEGTLVLGADVNDEPGSAPWELLATGLTAVAGTGPTFPARAPGRRIDALLVDRSLAVDGSAVEQTGTVSDHLALRADLRPGQP